MEAVREGESCVSYGGRLVEALICADVYRRTCAVKCRRSSLIYLSVLACLLERTLLRGGFVVLSLVGDNGGGGRGWLDVWDNV